MKRLLPTILLSLLLTCCVPPQPGSVNPNSIESISNSVTSAGNKPNILPADYPVKSIHFTNLTGEDGISQSIIQCMLQDRYGYIWLGTQDGLNKFDGKNFRVYKNDPSDPNSLSYNDVTSLAEGPDGTLWIGTRGGGLNVYTRSSGKFYPFTYHPEQENSISSDYIQTIAVGEDGVVWIGTLGGGLNRYDPATKSFTHFLNQRQSVKSISSNQVNTLAIDRNGKIWVGTSYGLDLFDPLSESFTNFRDNNQTPVVLSRSVISSLMIQANMIWVGTDAGLFFFDPITGSGKDYLTLRSIPSTVRIRVNSLSRTSNGTIWVGTDGYGLFRISPDLSVVEQLLSDPRNESSLTDNRVLSILEDNSGTLWFGTNSGFVNQIDPLRNRFNSIVYRPWENSSLSESLVWAVLSDGDGSLWIGTDGGGLNRYDLRSGTMQYYRHNPKDPTSIDDDHVQSLLFANRGALWVGTDKGLNLFNINSGSFSRIPLRMTNEDEFQEPKSSGDNNPIGILAIKQDDKGILWIGTENSGLFRYDPSNGNTLHFGFLEGYTRSLPSNTVWALYPDSHNTLWIGTDRGLTRMDTKFYNIDHFLPSVSNRGSLSDYRILSIFRDSRNILWVGTSAGLNRFDEQTSIFSVYTEKDGLPNNYINSIQEDDLHRLWISTNKGISLYYPDSESFINYDQKDGLAGNEFNQNSANKDKNGQLYFGGINGVTYFHPLDIHENNYLPNVVLTGLTQGGDSILGISPVEVVNKITLTWPKNYFEFTFQNQASSQVDESRYAYRLVPFENDWVITESIGAGRYTNLPGGRYVLHIRSTNNEGRWTDDQTALTITVIAPMWQNKFFLLAVGLMLIGMVSGGILLRTRSIQMRNRELSSLVRLRTREIDQRRQVAEGLRDILVRINSNQSIEESLRYIAGQIINLIKADQVLIFRCCDEKKSDLLISVSSQHLPVEILDQDVRWIYELVSSQASSQVLSSQYLSQHRSAISEFATGIAIPVFMEDHVDSVLVALSKQSHSWSEDELELFISFSEQIALALGNARLRLKEADLAMLNERNRLARDLHDAVTQTLFSASLLAEALPSVWENNPAEGRKLIKEMRCLTRGALAEMRSLLMELRPSAMAEAKLNDLLRQLSEAITGRTGLGISLESEPDIQPSCEVSIALYRIAQEALNNIVKHAHAKNVIIRCKRSIRLTNVVGMNGQPQISLQVEDDGCGFTPESVLPDHFGLYNMHERAESIGAELDIQSSPGKGTVITVRWVGEENQTDDRKTD